MFAKRDLDKMPIIHNALSEPTDERKIKVYLYDKESRRKFLLHDSMWISSNITSLEPLRDIIGYENVKIVTD